ncbi:MAG: DUF4038 domain-containing protein [Chloroflexia bacterium]|nr:DUF4038 domain-containing protein [Chloroflexia bacterium]
MSEQSTPVRAMREWAFETSRAYAEPFTDVRVTATFTDPSGAVSTIEAFHDGDRTWRVRYNPGVAGRWSWRLGSNPPNSDFEQDGEFTVEQAEVRGFLRSTPGEGWGFTWESGEPVFILGDTTYHLFGMAHDSDDGARQVRAFMERRAAQGFNLLRVRLPVSLFHPPDGYNTWQTRRLWAWGGSEQSPRFDRFNVPYFQTVDSVLRWADELGIGIELIMEGWGFEFPFNSRNIFVPEWEELWLRYLVARFDAFGSVTIWTLQNEYEYYPNGDWHYQSNGAVCDRWAIRVGHLMRRIAPHGHIIAIHNGPVMPSFGKRFASDPYVIDTVMFQTWGTVDERDGWLAAGIEDQIPKSLGDWPGSAILSEYGYEFNPDLPPMMLAHQYCDPDHTRRGAWRGAMSGLGIIQGFENTWGPAQVLDQDQAGLTSLLHLRHFFTGLVPFDRLQPVTGLARSSDSAAGHAPLAMATPERDIVVVYLPVGGEVSLEPGLEGHKEHWFDPRIGEMTTHEQRANNVFTPPERPAGDHPDDWVLVLRSMY